MPVQLPDGLPTQADFVDVLWADLGEIEARLNRQSGKSGIMLGAADALLGHREKKFPIADNAGGGVVHLGIVQAKGDQRRASDCLWP